MPAWQIALIVVGVILVALVLWFIATYNSFVALRNRVEEAWRQIDVELNRRHDLIPNLVETVKGYAAHERGTLEAITNARASAVSAGADRAQQVQSENMLTEAIGRLFAVAEQYPQLQADANFRQLQSDLTATEDRIANGRRYYNAVVREFNTKLETFPASIVGSMTGFRRATYFEAQGAQRENVQVDFGQGGGARPSAGSADAGAGSAQYGPPQGQPQGYTGQQPGQGGPHGYTGQQGQGGQYGGQPGGPQGYPPQSPQQ
ncbi:MAG TPA: LemA family protein [Actinomycetales bacterium]|nr:LemA family protein [Actinomycetales bacterium]